MKFRLDYRWSYYCGKPEELFKELIWRPFKNLVFRCQNGYYKSDTWSLDYTLAKWILPRIKGFRKVNNGWPCDETDLNCDTPEHWDATIDKMIAAFQGIVDENDNYDAWYSKGYEDKYKQRQEGLELFGKYLSHLWW